MRWLTIALVALTALVLVSAGCGGDDEESASDTTELTDTLTDDTTTDETTTDDDTEETTTDDDLSGVFENEDCLALVAAVSSFAQAFGGQGVSDETEQAFAELAEKVPDEIEDDVQVLADAYDEYAAELKNIGLDPGETPNAEQLQQLQAALQSFGDEGVAEASERISAWAQTNCTSG
jgi:hypothetical protein